MENDQLIATEIFCTNYGIEYSFVQSLQESGLIETVVIRETQFLPVPQLQKIERVIRLYHDLDINIEGIEAIDTLLNRIDYMEKEIIALKNKLRFYEGNRY
ncbi:chaperone modulator CbpM [Dyadobacter bucti]|uniref:chaperone modulator CbpM n=1 Tax=Dyadobacter bucti TaxID=2572203 RepID=UPI003F71BDF9